MTPALNIEFEGHYKASLKSVTVTFSESSEEVSGYFNTSTDEFEPSWYSSEEAEELYDTYWEEIEEAIINAYYK